MALVTVCLIRITPTQVSAAPIEIHLAPIPIGSAILEPSGNHHAKQIDNLVCIKVIPTATTITSSPNPSTYGQSVSFTVTVTSFGFDIGTPPDDIVFYGVDGTITEIPFDGIVLTTSSLSVGTHSIHAYFEGGGCVLPSYSNLINQVVNLIPTTITLSSSPNPCVRGQTVTFTATVFGASGTPTGTVSFYDNSKFFGTSAVNGTGKATFTMTCPGASANSISAQYGGSPVYAASASNTLNQVFVDPPSDVPEGDTVLLLGGGLSGIGVWLRLQWNKRRTKN